MHLVSFLLMTDISQSPLDHLIFGPKFGLILNAKKYVFFPNSRHTIPNLTKKNIFFFGGGGGGGRRVGGAPSLFHIKQIHNILLHIHNFTE